MSLTTPTRRLAAVAALTVAGLGAAAPILPAAGASPRPTPEAGKFVDNDSAAIIAGSVRVRSCLTNGFVNLEWTYNSVNNSTAARWTAGCVSIIRNGATTARLLAEYRTASGALVSTRQIICSKGITVNPVANCPLNTGALDLPATVGVDQVLLRLKTTSPAGVEVTQTVVVGD